MRALLFVVLAGWVASAGAIQQTPTFRAGVQTVPVFATVTDRSDQIVKDLTRGDFEIYDNGVRQDITLFSSGLHPITAVLLLDTSNSMTLNIDTMKRAAEQFAVRLLPGDRARVGSFSDRISISPRFTDDRDELLRVISQDIEIGNPTLLWDAIDRGMSAAEGQDGRRVVIVFTDGADTISKKSERDVAHRAEVEGLAVYVLWMRGNFRLLWDRPLTNVPPAEDIRNLAKNTGGGFFGLRQTDDLDYTVNHVSEELHFQYALGFTPAKLDDKMHDIDVRVTPDKRKELTVRARKSYLAAKDVAKSAGAPSAPGRSGLR